jgi:hypothetical protein
MTAHVTFEITTADQLIFDLNIVDKYGLPVQKYGTVGCLFPTTATSTKICLHKLLLKLQPPIN